MLSSSNLTVTGHSTRERREMRPGIFNIPLVSLYFAFYYTAKVMIERNNKKIPSTIKFSELIKISVDVFVDL